jgi:hypothetical protein
LNADKTLLVGVRRRFEDTVLDVVVTGRFGCEFVAGGEFGGLDEDMSEGLLG